MAVTIPIISEFDGKGISRAVAEFKNLEGAGAKAKFALQKAALPAAAAIGGLAVVIGDATKAAIEDAKAQALLAAAIEKNTLAGEANVKAAEAYIEKTMMAAAVADDQLRPALATLVQTTGDLTYSQDLLNTALDISAATGTDLQSVTDAVAKAYAGNTKALGNLVPAVRGLIKDGASLDEIMQALNATVGGAAAVAANSAEGQMKRLSLTIGETKEAIGAAFLPILEKLLPKLQTLALFIQQNTSLVVGLIIAIGSIATAILVLNTALKIVTLAQIAFNVAMAANPIGLAVVAISALVAGMVLLEEKTGLVTSTWSRFGLAIQTVLGPVYTLVAGLMAIADFMGIDVKLPDLSKYVPSVNVPKAPAGPTSGPDFLERRFAPSAGMTAIPTIPAPVGLAAPVSGGGGGGGGTRAGGGSGFTILPIDEGFIGGGGGGFGAAPGNEALLDGMTGGITVIVNAAIAEATLADTIVDALTDYNRRSGPLQLEIA
jgi:hypothetical protein